MSHLFANFPKYNFHRFMRIFIGVLVAGFWALPLMRAQNETIDLAPMEVVADRENNRITVDAQGVERFELLLNDDLIDLDKEFTLVINGKASKETRRRSFRDMKSRMMLRNDWDYLFPVRHMASVTKE